MPALAFLADLPWGVIFGSLAIGYGADKIGGAVSGAINSGANAGNAIANVEQQSITLAQAIVVVGLLYIGGKMVKAW
jgi:hypothetical protein